MFRTYSSNMSMSTDAAFAPANQSAQMTSANDAALLRVVSFLFVIAEELLLHLAVRIRLPQWQIRRT